MIKNISTLTLKSIFVAMACFVVFVVICSVYIIFRKNELKDRIYPNVYINNVSFAYKNPAEVKSYLDKQNKQYKNVKFLITYKDQIATFSGSLLKIGYDSNTLADQAYLIGRSKQFHSRIYQQVKAILNIGRFDFNPNLVANTQPVEDFLDNLEDRYNKPAENALFTYDNGKVTAFKIEKNGIKIDSQKTLDVIEKKISQLKYSSNLTIAITVPDVTIKPEVSLASINNYGIVEEIGHGQSDYSGSIASRVYNVILAAEKFNGVLIPKGAEFSFNDIIGDISASTGYQQAYIIKNGRTVLGDGGGVCQVSTTLFRTALNTGLPITERWAHAYRVHYYENDGKPGLDATTFNPGVDFKFKNDTPGYILIQTEIDKEKNLLTFHFYGKKDDRKIELSDITVFDQSPPLPDVHQDDPTLKKGVVKQVDWAAPGAKSTFHYKVENNGVITQDRDFLSVYRPWAAVYLVGTAD
jgi:vancomycin resistance protein YoaR